MTDRVSVTDLVERAYDLEADPQAWLRGVGEAAQPLLDSGLGLIAWIFDGSDPGQPILSPVARIGGGPALDLAPRTYLDALGADINQSAYTRAPPICTASEVARLIGVRWTNWLRHAPPGNRDCLAVAALGPDRQGVMIAVPLPERRQIGAAQRRLWALVAAHLAAAFQLRQHAGVERTLRPLRLTEREREVSTRVALGHQLKLVAWELGLDPKTVSFHLRNALRKLETQPPGPDAQPPAIPTAAP